MDVTLPLAFAAGIVSFLSPCFLPIVPAFVAQLVGDTTTSRAHRRTAVVNSLGFVLGFSVIFVALWASFGALTHLLVGLGDVLRIAAGVVVIILGLHVAGWIHIDALNRALKLPPPKPTERPGLGRAILLGVVFGAGWTPCIGPILGGIIALAASASSAGWGLVLMLVYCAGLGLPLVAVAVGIAELGERLAFFTKHQRAISIIAGVMLIGMGFLIITGLLGRLSGIIAFS